MVTIEKVKELLKDREEYKNEYFDTKKYLIGSFIQDYEIIFYVYDSALGTAKLQGQETVELDFIVRELKNYKGNKILSISINPVDGKGDYVTILTDPFLKSILGIYRKIF